MSDFNSQPTNAQPKKRNTKTASEKEAIRKLILSYLAEGKNPREIRRMLNLTQDQYNRYITKSLELGELSQQPQDVPYAMIYFKSLRVEDRTELRKRLQMDIPDSAVLKFEKRDKEIICTITSVADVKNGADDAHSSDEGVEDD